MKNPEVRGDQYVTVQIAVPKYLNPEAEQKLREFENVCAGRSSERRKSALLETSVLHILNTV